eukprot:TRINITY_DN14249_c0_g1_i1.p1 TRINITY_DN14249_c0_g1~~TRINITY_DN14249_c0_g1_i1.p1  ORF type:complete len:280 (-),score=76.58 TRINITY_DN14249_c0_g1_i1:696-1535(-)
MQSPDAGPGPSQIRPKPSHSLGSPPYPQPFCTSGEPDSPAYSPTSPVTPVQGLSTVPVRARRQSEVTVVYEKFSKRLQQSQSSFLNCHQVNSAPGMMDALREVLTLRHDIESHAQTDLAQSVAQSRSSDWNALLMKVEGRFQDLMMEAQRWRTQSSFAAPATTLGTTRRDPKASSFARAESQPFASPVSGFISPDSESEKTITFAGMDVLSTFDSLFSSTPSVDRPSGDLAYSREELPAIHEEHEHEAEPEEQQQDRGEDSVYTMCLVLVDSYVDEKLK